MKQRLLFLVRTFAFWLLLFVVAKLVFLVYEFHMTSQLAPAYWFKSIWHGLQMDIAMTSYIVMVYAALMALTFFLREKTLSIVFKSFNILFLSLFLLVLVVDLEIYRNWGFHLDTTPFQYLKTPKEAAASTPLVIFILVIFIYAISLFFSIRIFKSFILNKLTGESKMKYYFAPIFLLIGGAMIIPIRGGFDVQPMNTSFVYYSSNIYANHVAVNPVWNFLYALDHMDNFDKDYDFISKEEAHKRFEQMMSDGGSVPEVLKTKRPNVLLVIMESFSSDLLVLPEVVPNLSKYTKEGLFFKNYYAVAGRSDKGIGAILSAYPAHPGDAVIKNSAKIEKMPNIGNAFKDMGYTNAFYYGGDINFANMNSYLNISRFDKIVTKLDFPAEYYGAKWGVHDGYTFERLYDDIEKQEGSYFKTIFTLSSHEPFDVPESIIKGESVKQKFLNTALYTDKHLGLFIDKLKALPSWDNTLVIITADHGSSFINRHKITEKGRYHIPMVWIGGALKEGGEILNFGSQTDLIATLLTQMDYPSDDFIFSKNLLSPNVDGFSYYTYKNEGCGYIDSSCYQVFDNVSKTFLIDEGASNDEAYGRVYLQKSYNYFLEK